MEKEKTISDVVICVEDGVENKLNLRKKKVVMLQSIIISKKLYYILVFFDEKDLPVS